MVQLLELLSLASKEVVVLGLVRITPTLFELGNGTTLLGRSRLVIKARL
jgi:hypothetical protein